VKKCRYCRRDLTVSRGPTRDHVIPKAVTRWASALALDIKPGNQVACCSPCNKAKGSIPVSVFLKYRLDFARLKEERHQWERMHIQVMTILKSEPTEEEIETCRSVLAEFLKPIPPHFVTGTRPISVRYADAPATDFVRGE